MGSLNVMTTGVLSATSVAWSAGLTRVTRGGCAESDRPTGATAPATSVASFEATSLRARSRAVRRLAPARPAAKNRPSTVVRAVSGSVEANTTAPAAGEASAAVTWPAAKPMAPSTSTSRYRPGSLTPVRTVAWSPTRVEVTSRSPMSRATPRRTRRVCPPTSCTCSSSNRPASVKPGGAGTDRMLSAANRPWKSICSAAITPNPWGSARPRSAAASVSSTIGVCSSSAPKGTSSDSPLRPAIVEPSGPAIGVAPPCGGTNRSTVMTPSRSAIASNTSEGVTGVLAPSPLVPAPVWKKVRSATNGTTVATPASWKV